MLIYVTESFLFSPKWFLLAKQVLFPDLATSLSGVSNAVEKQEIALSSASLKFKVNTNMHNKS